jgi:hypothetical protein
MATEADMAAEIAARSADQMHGPCPHLVWRNVLGAETVAALLDYAVAREKDFRPTVLGTVDSPAASVHWRNVGRKVTGDRGSVDRHQPPVR